MLIAACLAFLLFSLERYSRGSIMIKFCQASENSGTLKYILRYLLGLASAFRLVPTSPFYD